MVLRSITSAGGRGWELRVRESAVKRAVPPALRGSYGVLKFRGCSVRQQDGIFDVTWSANVADDTKAALVALDARDRVRKVLTPLGLRLGSIRVTLYRPSNPRGELYGLQNQVVRGAFDNG
jgi:hypothetical protein